MYQYSRAERVEARKDDGDQNRPLPEAPSIESREVKIRLIVLHASPYHDDPTIELVTVVLCTTRLKSSYIDRHPDLPRYEAISYAWGDANWTRRIRCLDNKKYPQGRAERGDLEDSASSTWMTVSETVFDMLHNLQLRDSDRFLWIDAICINQNDSAEKSEQIASMGVIYELSRQVIVFVPTLDEAGARLARDAVTELCHIVDTNRGPTPLLYDEDTTDSSGSTFLNDHIWCCPVRPNEISAFSALLQQAWFTRTWVCKYTNSRSYPTADVLLMLLRLCRKSFFRNKSSCVTVWSRCPGTICTRLVSRPSEQGSTI